MRVSFQNKKDAEKSRRPLPAARKAVHESRTDKANGRGWNAGFVRMPGRGWLAKHLLGSPWLRHGSYSFRVIPNMSDCRVQRDRRADGISLPKDKKSMKFGMNETSFQRPSDSFERSFPTNGYRLRSQDVKIEMPAPARNFPFHIGNAGGAYGLTFPAQLENSFAGRADDFCAVFTKHRSTASVGRRISLRQRAPPCCRRRPCRP